MALPNHPRTDASEDRHPAAEPRRPSLRSRLRAWWEGYDLRGRLTRDRPASAARLPAKPHGAPEADPDAGRFDRHGKPLWTATRIEVAEKLWGKGLIGPGGEDYVPDLVKPLGLNKTMSVLDLSAGLGGITRLMAKRYGAWVTGLEVSPVLAKHGMAYSRDADLWRQAPIEHYDPRAFNLDRHFDAIFAKEIFFCLDKDRLFPKIRAGLKPGGQLLFTDYLMADTVDLTGLAGWADAERLEPFPWTQRQMATCLKGLGFDIRIALDMTQPQLRLIVDRLAEFHDFLAGHNLDDETRAAVTDEVALWARRARALRNGLRLYRVHCLV